MIPRTHSPGQDALTIMRRAVYASGRMAGSLRTSAFLLGSLLWLCLLANAEAAARPNIVYILADDMGVGDVSCLNPGSAWKTPHLDRLATQGRTFTDAHSASGVCTPSRYALLTGRYSWRGTLKAGVLQGFDPPVIEPGRMTVASFLREQGYATAMVGKWHLGVGWARKGGPLGTVDYEQPFSGGPTAHGFDRFFGISASLDMAPYVYMENDRAVSVPTGTIAESPKPKMWRAGPISDDFRHEEVHPRFMGKALAYLAERGAARDGKPFFLYLALASPHTPIVPTPEFAGKTATTPYGDFVAQVDSSVGELLAALDRHGLATNTLVIFTADNGCAPAVNLEELKRFNHDPSAGFRGHKADLFEGGHRVPFFARWPGQIPAGTRCSQTVGQLDLLATCADLLGAQLPDSAGEDSVSLLPLLRGSDEATTGRQALVHHSNNGSFAVREGPWKLLLCRDSGGWSAPRPGTRDTNGLPRFQLYNMAADPSETNNLSAAHPEIVQRLGRWLTDSIERGRSTPGAAQPVDKSKPWPQASWREAFSPPSVQMMRTPEDGLQPQVAAAADGSVHVVFLKGDPQTSDVQYARMGPQDKVFGPSVRVNREAGSAIAVGTIRGVQFALGREGRVHVVWNGSRPAASHTGVAFYYARSGPGGTNFEPERDLIRGAGLDGGGSVVADPKGHVSLVWHLPASPAATDESGRAVFMASSEDDGGTFKPEVRLTSADAGVCACCGLRAGLDSDGQSYVLYRAATRDLDRDIVLLAARAGSTEFKPVTSHRWKVAACPMSSASLSEQGDAMFAAWETAGKIYWSRVQRSTFTAGPKQQAKGQGLCKHPVAAHNGRGQTILAWTEETGWQKGGRAAWQVMDAEGLVLANDRVDGVPAWGLVAVAARPDGSFVLVY